MPLLPRLLALAPPAFLAMLGCASPEPRVFYIRVEVVTQDGHEPVAGAVVRVRGERSTPTDARGRSLLHVRGQAGDRMPASLACPAGSSAPGMDSELILPGAPAASPEDAPSMRFTCPSVAFDAVVLVHASGGATSLPVKVDGSVVGQTDPLGFAHVHVRTRSRAAFDVSLDTSANPALSPSNPTQHFQIDGGDELLVFETAFASGPTRKARRPANKRRGPVDKVD